MHPWRFLKIDETHIILIHLPQGARAHTPPPPSPRPVLLLDSTHSAETWEVPACFFHRLSTPAVRLSFRASCLTPGPLQRDLFTLSPSPCSQADLGKHRSDHAFHLLKTFLPSLATGRVLVAWGLSFPRSGLSCLQPQPCCPPSTHPVPPRLTDAPRTFPLNILRL